MFSLEIYSELCNIIRDIICDDTIQLNITDPFRNKLLNEELLEEKEFYNRDEVERFNYNNPNLYFELLSKQKLYYPPKPYYKHVSILIESWGLLKRFPIYFKPLYGLFEVVKSEQEKSSTEDITTPDTTSTTTTTTSVTPSIVSDDDDQQQNLELIFFDKFQNNIIRLIENWEQIEKNERINIIVEFISCLSNRNLLTMMGVRKTKLSLDSYMLPGPIELICSSNLPNKVGGSSKLTVSSRALSKHGIRSDNSFWGSDKGPELVKNKRSEKAVLKVLSSIFWINIHMLPHNIPVIEIRNDEGYGLRWSSVGDFFRGFLEPQMEDGHENGWRH